MAEAPIWPVATDAFIADTIHLDAEQTGAYMMLLMSLWRAPNAQLPLDDKKLCRMARVAARRWPAVWSVISEFFIIENGLIEQKRVTSTRLEVHKKIELARANGKQGGRSKWLKNKDMDIADGSIPLKQNDTKTEPRTKLLINHKPNKTPLPPRAGDPTAGSPKGAPSSRPCRQPTAVPAEFRDQWCRVIDDAGRSLEPAEVSTYLLPLAPIRIHDGKVLIQAPSRFLADQVRSRYGGVLSAACASHFDGARYELVTESAARLPDEMPSIPDFLRRKAAQPTEAA